MLMWLWFFSNLQNVNKDGLQYAELMFNPLPNGTKSIIHGEDKTIYAEVDTTQTIDPILESDDKDKGNETWNVSDRNINNS